MTPKRECKEDLDGVEGKLMVAQKAMAIQREHLEDLQDQLRWCREKLQAALKHAEELEKENDELKQQCQNSSEPSTSGMQPCVLLEVSCVMICTIVIVHSTCIVDSGNLEHMHQQTTGFMVHFVYKWMSC